MHQLNLSMAAVVFIIAGGLHEIVITILKKIDFLRLLIKNKVTERNKVHNFFEQAQDKGRERSGQTNRVHPMALPHQPSPNPPSNAPFTFTTPIKVAEKANINMKNSFKSELKVGKLKRVKA